MQSDVNVEQVIRDYLPDVMHMSLATCQGDKPWVCEVHFVYDDHLNLYFRSLPTRRHSQEITANPNVAGNIVRQHTVDEYPRGVYFEGTAQRLENSEERAKVSPYFQERLGMDKTILEDAERPDGHHFYKITVENWYVFGKFTDTGGQKYQLVWNGGQQ